MAMTRTIREVSKARANYDKNRRAYDAALRSFSGRVRTLLAKEGLAPIITHRVKEFDSYLGKLARLRQSQARGPILLRDFLWVRVVARPVSSDDPCRAHNGRDGSEF